MDFEYEHRQVSEAVRKLKGPLHSGDPYPSWRFHSLSILLTAMVHYHDNKYSRSLNMGGLKRQFTYSAYSDTLDPGQRFFLNGTCSELNQVGETRGQN